MDPLARLAARAALDPTFLGYSLAAYQRRRGLSDAALAAELGLAVETLTHLRLCGAVRAGSVAADVAAVAAKYGADPKALAVAAMG